MLNKVFKKLCGSNRNDPRRRAERFRRRGVDIGFGTLVYPDVVLGRGGADPIKIGRDCVLTGCTILGHDASTNGFMRMRTSICRPVSIGDRCFIGHRAIVIMGVTIGNDCIVGAGTVVTKDVEDGNVVVGNPARVLCSTDELVQRRVSLWKEHPEFFRDPPYSL